MGGRPSAEPPPVTTRLGGGGFHGTDGRPGRATRGVTPRGGDRVPPVREAPTQALHIQPY
jgi:hypothetical protein